MATEWLMRNWRWALPAGAVVAVLGGWLAIGFFGVHTLFFDDEVDQPAPVFVSGAGASGLPSDATSPELAAAMNEAIMDGGVPAVAESDDAPPQMTAAVSTTASGSFSGRAHPTSGRAIVLNDGTEQRFLRFEDFETDNGPDLNVYLSAAPAEGPSGAFDDDFIDLGDLKGNVGPQNYEIPPGVDLGRYSTVVIWCVRFSVAFGAAELSSQ